MKGSIKNQDFLEIKHQGYWSFPSSYSKERKAQETKNLIFSGDYLGTEKKDGYYERFIKDDEGNCFLVARNKGVNGIIEKIEWVPHLNDFFKSLPNGTCLIGEVHLPSRPGSKNITSILGCLKEKALKRQEDLTWRLHYYIFDIYAYDGKLYLDASAQERFALLEKLSKEYSSEYVEFAKVAKTPNEIWSLLERTLDNGGEGIVITMKDYPVGLGKRTARKTLKVKKELQETIDAIFTGAYRPPERLYTGKDIDNWKYWENEMTGEKIEGSQQQVYDKLGAVVVPVTKPYFYGWAGSLEIGLLKEDKVVPIGFLSGLSEEIKKGIVTDNKKYRGQPIEVTCMEIDKETKGLRHPRFVQFRKDLTIQDCTWEKVYGEE